MTDAIADHRRACDGFAAIVRLVGDRWGSASPCTEWDARGVLEHVIGFHDVLLLRPMEAKPSRPRDDPEARWTATVEALFGALDRSPLDDKRRSLLGYLSTDVLVHTWDLAKAVGAEVTLDGELCRIGLERALAHASQFEGSDMFAPAVEMADDADVQDRLVAFFGRDPAWRPPA